VIGEPPTRIASFISRSRNGSTEPIAIEFEKLAGISAEIGKFFLKRDHGSCSLGGCAMLARFFVWTQVEITHAEARLV